jgi:hypothetical protein
MAAATLCQRCEPIHERSRARRVRSSTTVRVLPDAGRGLLLFAFLLLFFFDAISNV